MLQTSDICVESGGHQLWYKHGCKMKCQNLFKISSRSENIHIDLWRPDLIGVWTCSSHTPAAFYMQPRFIVGVSAAGMCYRCYFSQGDKRKKMGKNWEKMRQLVRADPRLALCLHCLTVSLWRAACLSSQCPFPWPCYWHGLVIHLLSDQITFCDHWLRDNQSRRRLY